MMLQVLHERSEQDQPGRKAGEGVRRYEPYYILLKYRERRGDRREEEIEEEEISERRGESEREWMGELLESLPYTASR